ncbi:hypothetical protein NKG05_16185 [Oerskovia sp. M15]
MCLVLCPSPGVRDEAADDQDEVTVLSWASSPAGLPQSLPGEP